MSEMVERVARALAKADGHIDPDRVMFNPFAEENVPLWTAFQPQARAAIAAAMCEVSYVEVRDACPNIPESLYYFIAEACHILANGTLK